uniref:ankyrin-2b isoform X1 n=1 Tax=Solea senegalensis TaxID=28829 RepID=UPI001CD88268|nr:ankyrin-2b isoform X1 [Solea senegalensis]
MTDFGDSLIECEQAEQDFMSLSMELMETKEVMEKVCLTPGSRNEQMNPSTQPAPEPSSVSLTASELSTQPPEEASRHMDEVTHRLYKVLYGYDVKLVDSDHEDASVMCINASPQEAVQSEDRKDEVAGAKNDEDVSNSEHKINVYQGTASCDLVIRSKDGIIQTQDSAKPKSLTSGFIQLTHDSLQPETEPIRCRPSSQKLTSETSGQCHSLVLQRSSSLELLPDTSILLTESRSSSPESEVSVNELNFLAPDSPIPQSRPLSPLPPTVLPWETSDDMESAQGQPLLGASRDISVLRTSEAEERPLTPMVPNKRPFGRPLPLVSDYSSERSISPQSLTFDIEDRTSSPESIIAESQQWPCTSSENVTVSPDFHDMRSSSPESLGSITAHCQLPPDSPIPEFGHAVCESFTFGECRSSSPESASSNMDIEQSILLSLPFVNRCSSPESCASVNEYKALSPDSPVPEFPYNWPDTVVFMRGERSSSAESLCSDVEYGSMSPGSFNHEIRATSPASVASRDEFVTGHRVPSPDSTESSQIVYDSISAGRRPTSPEPVVFDIKPKPQTPVELVLESDDDWVIIGLSDIDEIPHSPELVSDDRPISPVTRVLRMSLPETETVKQLILSDKEHQPVQLQSHFEEQSLSPNYSDSTTSYGLLSNPVIDLPPEEDMALEPADATINLEDNKAKSNVIVDTENKGCVLSKALDESLRKNSETVATNIETVVLGVGEFEQCQSHESDIEKSKEEMHNPLTEETNTAPEGTSSCELVQNVTKYQNESAKFIAETHEAMPAHDQTLTDTVSDDLLSSLTFPKNVPEDQQKPSLAYDAKFRTLISPICDPQYVGKTFISKTDAFHLETITESYQTHLDEADAEETMILQLENDQRPLSPDSEAEYRPMSPESLSLLESYRPGSSHSGRSVDSQRALSPDSPIPQYLHSLDCPSQIYHRSVSTESALSDVELETGLDISFPFEDRSVSPDSAPFMNIYRALSPDSPIPDFRPSLSESVLYARLDHCSSIESVASDVEYGFVSKPLLFTENRLSSPNSDDVNRPPSPESPIPVLKETLSEVPVSKTLEGSLSLVSVCSDLEHGTISQSQQCSEARPSIHDSVVPGDDCIGGLTIPNIKTEPTDLVIVDTSTSPKSVTPDVECVQSCEVIVTSKERSDLESHIKETTERGQGGTGHNLKAIQVPVYRLVYSAEPWKLVSQICDPQYVGETYCNKTAIFEYAGTRTEYVLEDFGVKEEKSDDGMKLDIAAQSDLGVIQVAQMKIERQEDHVLDDSGVTGESNNGVKLDITESSETDVVEALKVKTTGEERPGGHVQRESDDGKNVDIAGQSDTGVIQVLQAKIWKEETLRENVLEDSGVKESEKGDGVKLDIDGQPDEDVLQAVQAKIEGEERPLSPDSDSEYRPLSARELTLISTLMSDSPESLKDSPPDSPIAQFSVGICHISQYLPHSPESPLSDEESELYIPMSFNETRPLSRGSSISSEENRVLSIDSPLPDFTPSVPESIAASIGYRLSSPESLHSDIEYQVSISDKFIDHRADSPESVSIMLEEKQSITSSTFRENQLIRQLYDPHYIKDANVSTTVVFKYVDVGKEHGLLDSDEERGGPISPNSVQKSIPQDTESLEDIFRPCKPGSPEFEDSSNSLHAKSSYQEGQCDPDSMTSEIELRPFLQERMMEYRSVSPQSVELTTEIRTASTDSTLVNKIRTLSPDSHVPQFSQCIESVVLVAGSRSSTPLSIMSDTGMDNLDMSFVEAQRESFSSDSENELKALSPDSPIPDFEQTVPQPTVLTAESPGSVCHSDIEYEDELFPSVSNEHRPPSPDSVASRNENSALSPDSPIPQFSTTVVERFPSFIEFSSASPESTTSDVEYAPFINSPSDTEQRPDSSEYLEAEVQKRPLSPDSESEYRPFSPTSLILTSNLRSSSPESRSSLNEFRPLSPDSPIPEFKPNLQESKIEYRSFSPESVLSEFDVELELPFSLVFDERPSSPESLASVSKFRRLSADSPILDFKPTIPHVDVSGYRSASPESLASDVEFAPLVLQFFEAEERPNSPQSVLSSSEYQRLSPDSPIPHYTHTEPPLYAVMCRSTSPESVYSDNELETESCLPGPLDYRAASPDSNTSQDEFRPLSPDSPIPVFAKSLQESFTSHLDSECSSPESVLSEVEIQLPFPMDLEDRTSSPESFTSLSKNRRLSPDSPLPDFRSFSEISCEFKGYRSSSPESEASEKESKSEIFQMCNFEDRAESPQSDVFDVDPRFLPHDSPLPQYTPSASRNLSRLRYRSTSPESVYSDWDEDTDWYCPGDFEQRAASPGSTASNDGFRCLSPDSPIPVFAQSLQESFTSHLDSRCSSPESVLSDLEMELSFPMVVEERPSSPESLASLSKNRRLSADSPLPDFRQAFTETYCEYKGYRSPLPESEASEDEYTLETSPVFNVEDRAESPLSEVFDGDLKYCLCDSPLPQYSVSAPVISRGRCRSISPESVHSDWDEENNFYFLGDFEQRATSPGSTASNDRLRPLSPDSPIPEFAQSLQESFTSHLDSRCSSSESVLSDLEMELSLPLEIEERPSSPESLASLSKNRRLSADSPLADFRQAFTETYCEFKGYESPSSESEASEDEYTLEISQMFNSDDRAESPQSEIFDVNHTYLPLDSPLPQYRINLPVILRVRYRSTSPESIVSDWDEETDLYFPWDFVQRAASPCSTASVDGFRPLSPDSPIPDFTKTLHESSVYHMGLRSTSPESVSSDLDMEWNLPIFLESRPSSPESLSSLRLSPDSPITEFMPSILKLPPFFGCRSTSPESACSDEEYIVFSVRSPVHEIRPSSPDSVDEYRALSPDSPIPEFRPAIREHVIVNVGYRSTSPESVESDFEYGLNEFLISRNYCVGNRQDSAESESLEHVRPLSVESTNEHQRLSPDSPLPSFTQDVLEISSAERHIGSLSAILSDSECDVSDDASFGIDVTDVRSVSPQSDRSNDEFEHLPPDSPVQDFSKTIVEKFMTWRDTPTSEISDSDDLSQTLDLFCAEDRSASPESVASDKGEFLLTRQSPLTELKVLTASDGGLSPVVVPTIPEESAIVVAEYNLIYDVELQKLISQVHDPQYAGETFSSKTGFLQFIGNKIEYESDVSGDEQEIAKDQNATGQPIEVTDQLTTTETASTGDEAFSANARPDMPVLEPPPPRIDDSLSFRAAPYKDTKYTFEIPETLHSDTEEDDLRYSPESLIDFRPMSPNSAMVVESRASSPESVASVNEFRRLSPDSPLPEFTATLPECVTFLRSASTSPDTLASDIEYMSLESTMHMADGRASSPESMPEFKGNMSLPPDSPIPQFAVLVQGFTTARRSSSLESLCSDSSLWEFTVTSSRAAETDRPSSPESISSVNEFRRLLPDSPVPVFMRILSSYFMDPTPLERSSSPMSLSSDIEFDPLPVDCWMDDIPRPQSPQTAESEEELGYCSDDSDRLVPKSKPLSFATSLSPEQHSPIEEQMALSPLLFQSSEEQTKTELETGILSYKECIQQGSETESTSTFQSIVCEEDFPLKSSPVEGVNKKDEKILKVHAGELESKTVGQMASPQTTDGEVQSTLLSATTATQDTSKIGLLLSDAKPMKTIPLQLPEYSSITTHRTVTPVLPSLEKMFNVISEGLHGYSEWELSPKESQSSELFSPMSSQFLVPPDYEAVFSGQQTLRVSECTTMSLDDLSPVSPVFSDSAETVTEVTTKSESNTAQDFEFSPDFKRVLSDFEKTVSEFESGELKVPTKGLPTGSKSPQHSDSDMEFFDCKQGFSDLSESEEVKAEHDVRYHISEPLSPMPGSSPNTGFLRGSPQYASHPFLQVDEYKRFSSGSESLGEFAYDSDGSRECRTEGDLQKCEELPSRDQAGYYDDDDFLGREIAEELGMLSSDSSEEEVLTTRVVRRRVIIQADNLPDIPPHTVTEEKYIDDQGNMVVKKITRKIIRKYVSPDGMESQEVTIEGSHQETVQIEEGDSVSRVVKRTVLHSEGDQRELTFSEPLALGAATSSEFEVEPVQGRKVSKVVKKTVVTGKRTEKQMGDPSLAVDLPSAREDFEKKPNA